MEDIRAIYRIFNNLKYEMENNGWVYQWHLGDEPIKVTHKFNPPVTPEEFQLFEKYFPNMKLPASYKAFFILLKWHGTFLRRGRQFFSQLYHLFFKKSAQRKGILE